MTVQQLTRDEVLALVDPASHHLIERWLARGDGVAVYENQDMGSPGLGEQQFVSFGSDAAQLETDDPPERLPDIGNAINWRFTLVGVCREVPPIQRATTDVTYCRHCDAYTHATDQCQQWEPDPGHPGAYRLRRDK